MERALCRPLERLWISYPFVRAVLFLATARIDRQRRQAAANVLVRLPSEITKRIAKKIRGRDSDIGAALCKTLDRGNARRLANNAERDPALRMELLRAALDALLIATA